MPSGSKKRKAAKKNKEQAAKNENSSTNNNPHGNDDSKSQDEGDTYGGDVGSPASQDDHDHHHRFNHREEERERAPSPVESHVTMEKYVDKVTRDAESREKCGLDDVENTHVAIQHVEHDKISSCTSSSDNESRASKKKSREEAYVFGTVMSAEALKVAGDETHGTEISTDKSGLNESEVKLLLSSDGISRVELEGNEGQVFSYSSSPPAEASNVTEKTQDSEPRDHSKKQPLVASTPPTVQTTSFLSCCGLFDVLTGSGR
ncbi:hypothetical protein ES288_A10G036500v1 [Gossypium darwinii]|uniref:Uncharacterized protein n=1 Tax=Gossypium darwinii TaxID=34276 RepID=A0A5D2EUL5_GOSDA|nr:hypothetical protein ES288_A10G036500v1 [Gossypium darwinii]TYG97406.1 hypothetical protein ES288_A10G036500v1 [Gossypium darwinii]TYG97407.1 hypothetical protein ES288_A10G036500v1 [Gossypium darwinii]TYG97408.1 hypothetical protein ES288_A10G036500v1 [Gossypium darwinii]